jgi:coenzyme Q-binding protein COQ10
VVDQDPTRNPDFLHYTVDRDLRYPCEPLFEIAADVERYPEFLPGWKAVRTKPDDEADYATDQMLAFGPVRERFTSKTYLERPRRIRVVSHSRTFRHFEVNWRFADLDDAKCRVHLDAHLGFKSRYMKGLVGRMLGKRLDEILTAFEARATALLGQPGVDRYDGEPLEEARGTHRRG